MLLLLLLSLCCRSFSRKLNVLGVFSKKKYVLVVIRRYIRKYYTLEGVRWQLR